MHCNKYFWMGLELPFQAERKKQNKKRSLVDVTKGNPRHKNVQNLSNKSKGEFDDDMN